MSYDNSQHLVLDVEEILVDTHFNRRAAFDDQQTAELAESMKKEQLQEVVVRSAPEGSGYKYSLVAGFRRTSAARLAGIKIKAIYYPELTEQEALSVNLSENIAREGLSLEEEVLIVNELISQGYTLKEIGTIVGKNYGWAQQRSRLNDLPYSVTEALTKGRITVVQSKELHAAWLASGEDDAVVEPLLAELAKKIAAGEKGATISPKRINPKTAKTVRGSTDIAKMMEVLRRAIGRTLARTALAWQQGRITDAEMYQAISEEAPDFTAPEVGIAELNVNSIPMHR